MLPLKLRFNEDAMNKGHNGKHDARYCRFDYQHRWHAPQVDPHHAARPLTNSCRLVIELVLIFALATLLYNSTRQHPSPSSDVLQQSISFGGRAGGPLRFGEWRTRSKSAAAWQLAGHEIGLQHLKIYVAELPPKYTFEAWARYVGGEWQAGVDFAAPLGPVIKGQLNLRMTNQFANDLWWYQQLLQSPLRVHKYEEADVVFVPGLFARGDPFTEPEFHQYFLDFFEEYPSFLPNVSDKPHVIGYPRVAWDNIGTLQHNPRAAPFLFTAIEAFSAREPETNMDLVVIPYQGHMHYSRGLAPALDKSPGQIAKGKSLLVSESFGTRLPFRKTLQQHCVARPSQCVHHEYHDHNATNFLSSWQLTERSWYCFQPAGDSPTRRSFFDCMLAGTIPVIFDYRMIDSLPFKEALDWYNLVQLLSPSQVEAGNAVDLLQQRHNETKALQLLANIQLASRVLQYSLNPVHTLIRYDAMFSVHPEDDAFTFSWKAIMRKLCKQKRLPQGKCTLSPQAAHFFLDHADDK